MRLWTVVAVAAAVLGVPFDSTLRIVHRTVLTDSSSLLCVVDVKPTDAGRVASARASRSSTPSTGPQLDDSAVPSSVAALESMVTSPQPLTTVAFRPHLKVRC